MAFAVVGDAINTTSRLQTLTRELRCQLVVSDALVQALRREGKDSRDSLLACLQPAAPQTLRGRTWKIAIWTAS